MQRLSWTTNAVVSGEPASLPGWVQSLRCAPERRGTRWHVRLEWEFTAAKGELEGYRIFSRCAGDSAWSELLQSTGSKATSVTVGPLAPSTYEFGVAAVGQNTVGPLAPSEKSVIISDSGEAPRLGSPRRLNGGHRNVTESRRPLVESRHVRTISPEACQVIRRSHEAVPLQRTISPEACRVTRRAHEAVPLQPMPERAATTASTGPSTSTGASPIPAVTETTSCTRHPVAEPFRAATSNPSPEPPIPGAESAYSLAPSGGYRRCGRAVHAVELPVCGRASGLGNSNSFATQTSSSSTSRPLPNDRLRTMSPMQQSGVGTAMRVVSSQQSDVAAGRAADQDSGMTGWSEPRPRTNTCPEMESTHFVSAVSEPRPRTSTCPEVEAESCNQRAPDSARLLPASRVRVRTISPPNHAAGTTGTAGTTVASGTEHAPQQHPVQVLRLASPVAASLGCRDPRVVEPTVITGVQAANATSSSNDAPRPLSERRISRSVLVSPAAAFSSEAALGSIPPLPDRPVNFTCDVFPAQAGIVSFEITWGPPANLEDAMVSHYLVVARREQDDEGTSLRVAVPYTHTMVRLSSVPRGRRYVVSLAAVGASGQGLNTSALVYVPPEASQPEVSTGTDPVSIPQTQSVHLQWPVLGGANVSGYRIWGRPGPDEEWQVLVVDTGSSEPTATCSIPGGTQYEFSVAALMPDGLLQAGEATADSQRLPDIVQGLRAVEADNPSTQAADHIATVHVSWTEPFAWSSGDPPVQEYLLAVYSGGASTIGTSQPIHTTRVVAPATEALLTGFARGLEYTVVVAAHCAAGEGAEASVVITPAPQAPQRNSDTNDDEGLSIALREFRAAMRRRWQNPDNQCLGMQLKRSTLFEDSVAVLGAPAAAQQYLQSHQVLQVRFEGEMGVDEGGLLREWLCLAMREGCRAERGVFEQLGSDEYIWPSAVGWLVAPEEAEAVLRLLGRLVGIALASGQPAGFMIHPIFWQWAFHADAQGEDEVDYFLALRHFDREQFVQRARLVYSRVQLAEALGHSPDALAAMLPDWQPLSEAEVEALELTWNYDEAVCGAWTSLPLRKGDEEHGAGDADVVTKADATEYLRLWSRQRIIGAVEAQLVALRDGILEVVPAVQLSRLNPTEIGELVVGVGWSPEELLPHVEVVVVRDASSSGGHTAAASDLFRWVREVLIKFTKEQREAFLQYCTGSPRLPAGGAALLRPKFTLQVIPSWSTESLPVAHTCANLLDIPLYPDIMTLRARLLTALKFGVEGFGLE